VEPDLLQTKDGLIVCAHGAGLSQSTDIENFPEFSSKKKDHEN